MKPMTPREWLSLSFVVIFGGLLLRERLITAYNEPVSQPAQPTGTVLAMYICDGGFALSYPDKNAQTPICVAYTPARKM